MDRTKEIYRVTLMGSVVNIALLLFKFIAGILGHSAAMVADAVHSLSDFVTDIIVLVFIRISGKPRDKSHDYGHGKFETLAMALIGVALLLVAVGILYHGVLKIHLWLNGGRLEAPGTIALWAALLSVVLKEGIYHYSMVKARQLDSQVVEANAWHHRSDALSSVGTAIGIGGAIFLGQRWTVLDPISSVIVGALIVKVAVDLVRRGIGDLLEQSLPDAVEEEILQLVAALSGVSKPHNLRTRRIGNHYAIELHILMDGNITLREAHDKASEVEETLKNHYGQETHVAVHMEPKTQNDEPVEPCRTFAGMNIEPIAFFRSPFTSKFGIPRQSGIVSELRGRIEFVPRYAQPEALRGLDQYDYLWLVWGFSENVEAEKHPTVRPPLLGGNERVGVWATRSPFRPNNLGLSSVRIARVDLQTPVIEVLGADLMDGTPIYDIKPYLAYVDSHAEARGGFTDSHQWQRLQVTLPEGLLAAGIFSDEERQALCETLALDPRPHYHEDGRTYGMPFGGYDIRFHVSEGVLYVDEWSKI